MVRMSGFHSHKLTECENFGYSGVAATSHSDPIVQ